MAVTRLPDVFPAHKRRVFLIALALQAALLVVLAVLLTAAGVDLLSMAVFFLLPVAVLQIFAFIIVNNYALEPLDFLARTVTHVSNQPHNTTPPNLNGTRHEKTGFKLMVDTIYGLATSHPAETPAGVDTVSQAILDTLPCGVIALNEKREVVYANQHAPLTTTEKDKQIQLQFDEHNTLEQWLTQVETSELSASKTWNRVQNAAPGEPGRVVYDVVATYQKNGLKGIDTLVLAVDQTARYATDEEDMDFIALAAHELRGPITVIRGYVDVLRTELDASLAADQKELFARLEVSANRLSSYIGNILNASKYDRRHLKLHLREERLQNVYALISDDLALRASTQGRLLSVTIPGDLPTIAADPGSLSEVFANIVDNAIKYSREGGQVLVTAGVDGSFVKVVVTDNGIGIPSSVVGNLFSKFYRSHRSRQTVAGTGLGLYISKAIIESHGGHVGVSSTEGQGSTFFFTVPIYSTVADKLLAGAGENQGIIETSSGWIKNHSMYQG